MKSGPGPLRLMARRAAKTLRGLRRRKGRERKGGRMPFRPHRWFGKGRRPEADSMNGNGDGGGSRKARRKKRQKGFLAIAAVIVMAAAATVPQSALADGHWQDEIDFELQEPVEGRRIFVEGLSVTGDRAAVTLRAATALDLRVRAFGGPEGSWLRFWGSASLDEGSASTTPSRCKDRGRPSPFRGRTRWDRREP